MRALVILALCAGTAAADPRLHGFVTGGPGELRGTVTSLDGHAVAGAKVHIVSTHEQIIATGKDGSYRATLEGGTSTFVYIDGDMRISGAVAVAGANDAVVEVHEVLPPAVPAKAKSRADVILDYTDDASDADAWMRAWLLLGVSERGTVTAVKVLADPGHGLAPIATKAAFGLRFEPALDRSKHPVRSTVLWTYEWPAYWWLIDNHYPQTRIPVEAVRVPCTGRQHRDCSEPDLAKMMTQPWLTPDTSK